uniref:Ig-like domain-containing protein n=1 Tax=Cyprinus carpio TaxID=7962 RepID=A0A8C1ZV72_CYPCA
MMMTIRKYRSPLPEYEVESTGIRPNHDWTFQMKKSVIIQEDEKAEFDCFVVHRSLNEPIIVRWGRHTKIIAGATLHCSKLTFESSLSNYLNMKTYLRPVSQKRQTVLAKLELLWFNVNVDILMKRMRQTESDLHVLQWRHGCEVVQEGDEVKFSKGISEYGYDGENFLSFDNKESQWVTSVDAALPTKRKWDNVPILNMYTKGYLEKECVDWLNKFREYDNEELRKASPPDVRVFARKSSDESKLKLTCLVTGFYSEDVTMTIRKYRTSLCENEVESTGIRPNHDGTFQLRKSVEINENEKSEYDCFVSHRTFKEPVIVQCGN